MSVARPAARCLFCSFSRTAPVPALSRLLRRQFHPSPPRFEEDENRLDISTKFKPEHFKRYSEKEKSLLKEEYTKAQIAAIEAGENAINPDDLLSQHRQRTDYYSFQYLDDFSTIEPVIDHHKRAPQTNYDPNSRLKTEDEIDEDIEAFIDEFPEDGDLVDYRRFTDNMRLTVGKAEAELDACSSLVPDLFEPGETLENIGGHKEEKKTDNKMENKKEDGEEDEDIPVGLQTLCKVTGYSLEEIRGLKVKTLVSHSVVNQTRLGKIRKAYVLTIAGNGRGLLGIGEGKSEEHTEARVQAQYRAIRNMQPVLRYEDRTIYGDVKGKVGAVELKLMHRPPGFGLRCQHHIWEMCRVAGIHDLSAQVTRSRNPMNTVKATYQALMSQKNPEDIARARGKKLVDVRKVYYAGNV
ncbi:28S ribosomal protein S5, mitochondrial [Ophidiomyces ophidiicola]|nr:28S ribosomal protein S5, mitochondrial [Ophidiomyces ophidiicola]